MSPLPRVWKTICQAITKRRQPRPSRYNDNHRARLRGLESLERREMLAADFGEIGMMTLEQPDAGAWQTVQMSRDYVDPVVIAGPLSINGSDPAMVRVRNVDAATDTFEVQIDEWIYLDGWHTAETFSYIVVEAGRHVLEDGTLLEAGTKQMNLDIGANQQWFKQEFTQAFTDAPVVFSQLASANGPDPAVIQQRGISSGEVFFKLREEEKRDNWHVQETVSWLAIEAGPGENNGNNFLAGTTGKNVTQKFKPINLNDPNGNPIFETAPTFLASMQTTAGSDTANVRYRNLNSGSVQIQIDEETSKDKEIKHAAENVGYLFWERLGEDPTILFGNEVVTPFVDLDVDSNNDGQIDPNNTATGSDDPIEVGGPGKFVFTNLNDDDGDGIVDYQDGIDYPTTVEPPIAEINVLEVFTPVTLSLADSVDPATAKLRLAYSDFPVDGDLQLSSGHMRLWTQPGNTTRTGSSVLEGGDFVAAGEYLASDLGFTTASRTLTFYLEGIRPTTSDYDRTITLEIDPDGSGSQEYVPGDTVFVSVVDPPTVDLQLDGLGEDLELSPGAIVWRNSDFSKQARRHADLNNEPEPLLPSYLPDYAADPDIFDPDNTYFTTGRVDIAAWMQGFYDIRFTFDDDNLEVWTFADYDGATAVGDDLLPAYWKIESGAAITPIDGQITFLIEGIGLSDAYGADTFQVTAFAGGEFFPVSDTAKYTIVETNAAVDGNRDSQIDFDNSHDRQQLFWFNNDQETIDADSGVEKDGFDAASPNDSADALISQRRDLEDFAPLRITVDPLLVDNLFDTATTGQTAVPKQSSVEYRLDVRDSDGAVIRLYGSADVSGVDNAYAHVSDVSRASTQVDATKSFREALAAQVANTQLFGILEGTTGYLFEAVGTLNDEVKLVFTTIVTYPDDTTTRKEHVIDLDLRNFKDFYQVSEIASTVDGVDLRKSYNADDKEFEVTHFENAVITQHAQVNDQPFFSGEENLVVVHGWNESASGKLELDETTFKRLYWQGYNGKMISFHWPNFSDSEGSRAFDIQNLTYNASELQAYRSGRALKNLLASLDSGIDGRSHLLAHSQGNVVVAEAFRQWNQEHPDDQLVDNYVAMQAAISAGVYGDLANDAFEIDLTDELSWNPNFYGVSNVDLNRDWWTGFPVNESVTDLPYMTGTFSAADQWINLYNPQDRATSLAWRANNLLKAFANEVDPDLPLVPGDIDFGIWAAVGAYVGASETIEDMSDLMPEPEIWQWRYVVIHDETNGHKYYRVPYTTKGDFFNGWTSDDAVLLDKLHAGYDPDMHAYEIIAFMSQANAAALGTKASAFFEVNTDIIELGLVAGDPENPHLAPDLTPNHNFEFNHDASTTWEFWAYIKQETGFRATYTNGE